MLATLSGSLALVVGLAVLLLPLLATELSRPRDAAWGAVVLLLGLVLVTSAERLTGSPMLAVLCGGLLIGRLGSEVLQGRWRQLTPEEQQRLGSLERWQSSIGQLSAALARLLAVGGETAGGLLGALNRPGKPKTGTGKRWVRPEDTQTQAKLEDGSTTPADTEATSPPATVVSSFEEIDALIEAAASGQAG